MGLFSSGQQKQDAADDSGAYTARDDADLAQTARSKRASTAGEGATPRRKKGEAADPMLPEKKRARRRLVGAIALALAVAVGLPMILDSQPKPIGGDIAISIPSKDKAAPLPVPAPANVPASAALDAKEDIVDAASVPSPSTAPAAPAATAPAAAAAAATAPATSNAGAGHTAPSPAGATPGVAHAPAAAAPAAAKPAATGDKSTVAEVKTAKPEQHAAAPAAPKPAEHKPEAKVASKDDKPAAKPPVSDDARALAILEGKPADKPKADGGSTKIVAQVGAYAAAEKVAEVQGKLRAAGIKTYTEKHGDVTRVRVGPFASKAEADQALARLEKLGLKGNIVTN